MRKLKIDCELSVLIGEKNLFMQIPLTVDNVTLCCKYDAAVLMYFIQG